MLAMVLLSPSGRADVRPPCGQPSIPAYPYPGDPPAIDGTSGSSLEAWVPPACTGWTSTGAKVLVALAASIRDDGGIDDFAARLGAISKARDIRFWSIMEQGWRPLASDATAVRGAGDLRRREDFSAAEMAQGSNLYFLQHDNRLSGEVIYRMRVLERTSDRLVLTVENTSPVRFLGLTLFAPEDIQVVYFVERRAPGVWGYYSLTRAARTASFLAVGREGPYVNRAIGVYRYLAGIPGDQEPPAAP